MIDSVGEALLLRPRRFGKSLTLSMLEYFHGVEHKIDYANAFKVCTSGFLLSVPIIDERMLCSTSTSTRTFRMKRSSLVSTLLSSIFPRFFKVPIIRTQSVKWSTVCCVCFTGDMLLHLERCLHHLSPGKPCLCRPCQAPACGDTHATYLSIHMWPRCSAAELTYMKPCCFAADSIYIWLRSAAANSCRICLWRMESTHTGKQ